MMNDEEQGLIYLCCVHTNNDLTDSFAFQRTAMMQVQYKKGNDSSLWSFIWFLITLSSATHLTTPVTWPPVTSYVLGNPLIYDNPLTNGDTDHGDTHHLCSPGPAVDPGSCQGSGPSGYWWLSRQTPTSPPLQPRSPVSPVETGLTPLERTQKKIIKVNT